MMKVKILLPMTVMLLSAIACTSGTKKNLSTTMTLPSEASKQGERKIASVEAAMLKRVAPILPQGPCRGYTTPANSTPEQEEFYSANHACFYEGAGFSGRSICRVPGDADMNLRTNGGNMSAGFEDRISSICVRGDVAVRVYEHGADKTMNTNATFAFSVSDLSRRNNFWYDHDQRKWKRKSWNDIISAIEVTRNRYVCFYTEENFYGDELCLLPGDIVSNLGNMWTNDGLVTFEDNIRSIYIPENMGTGAVLSTKRAFIGEDIRLKTSVLDVKTELPQLLESIQHQGFIPGISAIYISRD